SARRERTLAPSSFSTAAPAAPPIVLFSSEGPKDSLVFVRETGEFVCNLATFELRSAVVATSAQFARGVNEMREAGLPAAPRPRGGAPPAAGRRWPARSL